MSELDRGTHEEPPQPHEEGPPSSDNPNLTADSPRGKQEADDRTEHPPPAENDTERSASGNESAEPLTRGEYADEHREGPAVETSERGPERERQDEPETSDDTPSKAEDSVEMAEPRTRQEVADAARGLSSLKERGRVKAGFRGSGELGGRA